MLHRKGLPIGVIVALLILALATVGVGYGLWSETLHIYGTVNTGEVDAALSIEEVDQLSNVNQEAAFNDYAPGFCSGYTIGQDCDDDGSVNDDIEAIDPLRLLPKDVAECTAWLDAQDPHVMRVLIANGYPSFNCFVMYNVQNTGTIPINIHRPVYTNPNPAAIHFNGWPPSCYLNNTQLDPGAGLGPGEQAFCNLHIHVEQPALENSTYEVSIEIFGHQWNENAPVE
ncbi:MAG: hypothetical protein MUO38_13305 [Anaerolineales bacterium]|nr:hypothetical protein [Anaerolineales bacterium]